MLMFHKRNYAIILLVVLLQNQGIASGEFKLKDDLGIFEENIAPNSDHVKPKNSSDLPISDAAISDYSKAIEINPKSFNAYFTRGFAFTMRGELDKAVPDFTFCIKNNYMLAKSYFWRAGAYVVLGSYDLAISDYSEAIKIEPDNADIYCGRGDSV